MKKLLEEQQVEEYAASHFKLNVGENGEVETNTITYDIGKAKQDAIEF